MFLRWLVLFFLIWVTGAPSRGKKIPTMRRIDLIVIHCTATRENQRFTEEMLEQCHRDRGFDACGYHYYVRQDGNILSMRPKEKPGAHAKGYNAHSIGIAYEGGLDQDGKPKDTRSSWQRHSLRVLVKALLMDYPDARVVGHRDLSPDKNGDGVISPQEWMKQCPCFEVSTLLDD